MIFGGAGVAAFPLSHRPHGNPGFYSHFWLRKVGFNPFQQEVVIQRFRVDGDELSGAKSAVRKLMNDTDCPLCNTHLLNHLRKC
jgi:hypothetical protein